MFSQFRNVSIKLRRSIKAKIPIKALTVNACSGEISTIVTSDTVRAAVCTCRYFVSDRFLFPLWRCFVAKLPAWAVAVLAALAKLRFICVPVVQVFRSKFSFVFSRSPAVFCLLQILWESWRRHCSRHLPSCRESIAAALYVALPNARTM